MILECKAFKFMAKKFGLYLYLKLIRGTMCIKVVSHPDSNIKVDCNNEQR